jgi:hypothetical protein
MRLQLAADVALQPSANTGALLWRLFPYFIVPLVSDQVFSHTEAARFKRR